MAEDTWIAEFDVERDESSDRIRSADIRMALPSERGWSEAYYFEAGYNSGREKYLVRGRKLDQPRKITGDDIEVEPSGFGREPDYQEYIGEEELDQLLDAGSPGEAKEVLEGSKERSENLRP